MALQVLQQLSSFVKRLLLDWRWFPLLCALVLAAEASFGVLILTFARNRYTEIDWIAYMQEVEGWLAGETDYLKLRGDTGPLVYPAGFVYLYSGLRWLTGGGRGPAAVQIAQWLFLGLYLLNHAVVLAIYGRTRPGPPWMVLLLSVSKRMHSLYFLRLFNDCWSMLGVHLSILAAAYDQWAVAGILLSLGVSVKMNGLLLAPAFGLLLLRNSGLWRGSAVLAVMVGLQVALGWPFLATHPTSYLSKAFELSRVFFHQWTVNWKFLPEDIFVSKPWSTLLLGGHLSVLALLAFTAWTTQDGGLLPVLAKITSAAIGAGGQTALRGSKPGSAPSSPSSSRPYRDGAAYVVYLLWACNWVGIVFARTLHYQFLTWYWYSLPFLLWRTRLPVQLKLAVLAGVEFAFNVGDEKGAGTPLSSAVLQAVHMLLLTGILLAPDGVPQPEEEYCRPPEHLVEPGTEVSHLVDAWEEGQADQAAKGKKGKAGGKGAKSVQPIPEFNPHAISDKLRAQAAEAAARAEAEGEVSTEELVQRALRHRRQ